MGTLENPEIKSLEKRLENLRHVLEGLLPIFHQVDRKVKSLQGQIADLERRIELERDGQQSLFENEF